MAETELSLVEVQVCLLFLPVAVRILRKFFVLLFELLPSFHVLVFSIIQVLVVLVLGHRETRLCLFFALASCKRGVKRLVRAALAHVNRQPSLRTGSHGRGLKKNGIKKGRGRGNAGSLEIEGQVVR